MKAPIRCCCNPGLLLGFVEVYDFRRGMTYNFILKDGSRICLDVEDVRDSLAETYVRDYVAGDLEIPDGDAPDVLRVYRELALKSNDTPLDQLRLIPGFVEVNREVPIGQASNFAEYLRGVQPEQIAR